MNITTKRGDTFEEVLFEVKQDNVPLNISSVRMQVRKNYGDTVVLDFTSVGSQGITITGVGTFKINKQIINVPAYNYIYDIEYVVGTDVYTDISGFFNVTNDVTR